MNLIIGSLRRGDIVRNKASGEAYIVDQTFGASAIAIRTISVTNPDEWVRVPSEREVEVGR